MCPSFGKYSPFKKLKHAKDDKENNSIEKSCPQKINIQYVSPVIFVVCIAEKNNNNKNKQYFYKIEMVMQV